MTTHPDPVSSFPPAMPTPVEPRSELVPSYLIPPAPPASVSATHTVPADHGLGAELVPAHLIPPTPRILSLREVLTGPEESAANPEAAVVKGVAASSQRIAVGTVSILVILAVLAGVSMAVMLFLNTLDGLGGGTQTQDLFAVGVWGLLVLIEGRPRLGTPGKRSRKKNSMTLSGFIILNPVLSGLLTLAGLATAGDPTAVTTLAVAGLSLAVIVWRTVQAVQALRSRNAHFARDAAPAAT